MTRLEFKSLLSRRLEAVPYEERQKTLEYYDEMICDRMEDGMSEAEAVAAMGDIDGIAAELSESIVGTYEDSPSEKRQLTFDDLRQAFLNAGSTIRSVVLMVATVIISALLFSGYAILMLTALKRSAKGLALIFSVHISWGILELGLGLILVGITILLFQKVRSLERLTCTSIKRYLTNLCDYSLEDEFCEGEIENDENT